MVKVIINADDFGKIPERNRAIDDCFKQGLISSAGIIVTGKYCQDAVNQAINGGYLSKVHIHFNLTTSWSDVDPEDRPLSEKMSHDALFCENGRFRPYKKLPKSFSDIRKWKVVYNELVAQFDKFKEMTEGQADYTHVDFHYWYNLSWPVALALGRFVRKYKITSVRYMAFHHQFSKQHKLFRMLGWRPGVEWVTATNIDYYLSKRELFTNCELIELYCHPNHKDGVFLDDSPSYLKHERQPMLTNIQKLRECVDYELVGWGVIN